MSGVLGLDLPCSNKPSARGRQPCHDKTMNPVFHQITPCCNSLKASGRLPASPDFAPPPRPMAGLGWKRLVCWSPLFALISACATSSPANSATHLDSSPPEPPLSNATILIIRHAEKPSTGSGLSPEGEARAHAYVHYFQKFRVGAQRLTPEYIVAADDSDHSQRSRLTVEPVAQALGMKPDLRFQAKRSQDLVQELQSSPHGKVLLICWHHHEIPELLRRLGADPEELLPGGEWPAPQFGWVLRLSYDKNGQLDTKQSKRIKEHLMPTD